MQRQTDDCQALAAAQGHRVVEVFTDNDISAYSGKPRPGYRRMLEAIADGTVDVVVAWHTDRLHRSPLELEEYISLSEKHNVTTRTVQAGELDLSTASGRMTARIHGAVSRQESEHKSERISRKAQELAMAGKYMGGGRPYGWQQTDAGWVLDEAEAAVVREAHSHVLAGFSLGSFIQGMAERGITTARGNKWSYATLRQMMLRPRNAGLSEWKGEVVGQSEFPAIVERHVWEATRSVLTDPSRRRSTSNKVKHLLSGIALCECLRPVRAAQIVDRKGVKHNIYRCAETGPGHVNKRMSYVDDHVEQQVVYWLAMEAKVTASAPVDEAVLEAFRTDEAAYRERLNTAARMFADGTIDGEQLAEMSKGIKAKLEEVRQKLHKADEKAAQQHQVVTFDETWNPNEGGALEKWRGLHVERKRAHIRATYEIVLHRHARGSARVFDPATVQIAGKDQQIHYPDLPFPATPEGVANWKRERLGVEPATP
ncbi:recombinase family protein [Pseudarthrobacter oxydans]|uniref:recombinase family protein n=1 Tax=Pseudarthrobacter oxydans TaxID=1671 RepID=UPI0034179E33